MCVLLMHVVLVFHCKSLLHGAGRVRSSESVVQQNLHQQQRSGFTVSGFHLHVTAFQWMEKKKNNLDITANVAGEQNKKVLLKGRQKYNFMPFSP